MDDTAWAEDDAPDFVAARLRGIVAGMCRDGWPGHPLPEVAEELRRRLRRAGLTWPPELVEPLARHIRDPHWSRKHPLQAVGLGLRCHHQAREARG